MLLTTILKTTLLQLKTRLEAHKVQLLENFTKTYNIISGCPISFLGLEYQSIIIVFNSFVRARLAYN